MWNNSVSPVSVWDLFSCNLPCAAPTVGQKQLVQYWLRYFLEKRDFMLVLQRPVLRTNRDMMFIQNVA